MTSNAERTPDLPLRAKLASSVSKTAAALSRAAGRGDGSVIGGWIGLKIDPDLLSHLAAGRQVALVSGTNGKTTTTRLTAAAMGVLGDVATNSLGANMPTGHTSALARAGHTPYAVLEVDEHYLDQVIDATTPHVVALLNLSRDQLDRAKEVAMMASLWRDALRGHDDTHVVANADDPMVVWAARGADQADLGRLRPAVARRLLGLPGVRRPDRRAPAETGAAPACDLRRPASTWSLDGDAVVDPGRRAPRGVRCSCRAGSTGPTRPPRSPSRPSSGCGRPTRSPGWGRSPRSPAATPPWSATGARSGCCWPRTRPAGWRRSTWPSRPDPAVHQRPRPRRVGHLVALRRRLLAAARPPRPDHRRPGDGSRRTAGGQRGAVRARARRSRGRSPPCRPGGSR